MRKTELKALHDHAKSFYKKAYYEMGVNSDRVIYKLYSYNSLVAILEISRKYEMYYNNKPIRLYLDHAKQNDKTFYSATTLRHIKEMIKQATDEIRHNPNFAVIYFDKNKILHEYSSAILRQGTKKELFKYALDYTM